MTSKTVLSLTIISITLILSISCTKTEFLSVSVHELETRQKALTDARAEADFFKNKSVVWEDAVKTYRELLDQAYADKSALSDEVQKLKEALEAAKNSKSKDASNSKIDARLKQESGRLEKELRAAVTEKNSLISAKKQLEEKLASMEKALAQANRGLEDAKSLLNLSNTNRRTDLQEHLKKIGELRRYLQYSGEILALLIFLIISRVIWLYRNKH